MKKKKGQEIIIIKSTDTGISTRLLKTKKLDYIRKEARKKQIKIKTI